VNSPNTDHARSICLFRVALLKSNLGVNGFFFLFSSTL
jgi:hypothetical protein